MSWGGNNEELVMQQLAKLKVIYTSTADIRVFISFLDYIGNL